MHYHRDEHDEKNTDLIRSRKPLLYSFLAVLLISAIVAAYMHSTYTAERTLHINSIMPIVLVNPNASNIYRYALGGMVVNITNNGSSNETVSFLMVSRSPNNEAYVLGMTQKQLKPRSFSNYTLSYQLPLINNNTELFVSAFSEDYITSKAINFTSLR